MAFYFYLSTKIIMVFITKSYQDLFGVRSYINAKIKDFSIIICANNYHLLSVCFPHVLPLLSCQSQTYI